MATHQLEPAVSPTHEETSDPRTESESDKSVSMDAFLNQLEKEVN